MEHTLSLSAIRARKLELNTSILNSQRELEDLAAAERMVLRFGSTNATEADPVHQLKTSNVATSAPVVTAPTLSVVTPLRTQKSMNLRDLVLAALRQSASMWMTTDEVRLRASDIKGEAVPLGSVAPTLSILKKAGDVVRDGPKVALTERLNETGPPDDLLSGPETALAAQ